jgi:hypothetical protein
VDVVAVAGVAAVVVALEHESVVAHDKQAEQRRRLCELGRSDLEGVVVDTDVTWGRKSPFR